MKVKLVSVGRATVANVLLLQDVKLQGRRQKMTCVGTTVLLSLVDLDILLFIQPAPHLSCQVHRCTAGLLRSVLLASLGQGPACPPLKCAGVLHVGLVYLVQSSSTR